MELEEIYKRLCTLGIPAAYMIFKKPQTPPFLIYKEHGADIRGADNYNLLRDTGVLIELYTAKKQPELEHQLEELFRDTELEKSTDLYIENEKLLKIEYTFSTITKIGG